MDWAIHLAISPGKQAELAAKTAANGSVWHSMPLALS
jgi:hypothetical protein